MSNLRALAALVAGVAGQARGLRTALGRMTAPIDLVLQRLDGFKLRENGRDRWRAKCPGHDGKSDASLSIGVGDAGRVLLTCWGGCATGQVVAALGLELADLFEAGGERGEPVAQPVQRAAAHVQHETLSDYGRELWRDCRPISGTARAYLAARCCIVPPADGDLRWHPTLKHAPSGYIGPALVGLVTDVQTGKALTLHRTWILASGEKAPVNPPRMQLADHRKAGGVIRLWPDEAVTLGLGIAEGIETALSLAHAVEPVWSAMDCGNLKALPVLPGIEVLTIAADHDRAGIEAAQACALRWAACGRDARVVIPETMGTDMNDVARAA